MPVRQKYDKDNVVVIDPTLFMERMLHYRERHHGWHIFRTIYWAIYLIVISGLLIYYNQIGFASQPNLFFGIALLILAVMLILYGLTEALHHKFLKKYG